MLITMIGTTRSTACQLSTLIQLQFFIIPTFTSWKNPYNINENEIFKIWEGTINNKVNNNLMNYISGSLICSCYSQIQNCYLQM